MSLSRRSSLVVVGVFAVLAGCGGGVEGPSLHPLTGVVTLDGQPLPNATITFMPTEGPIATAVSDDAGRFTAQTSGSPGAVEGTYSVAVVAAEVDGTVDVEVDSAEYERMMSGAESGEAVSNSRIPVIYNDATRSGLTAVVSAGQENDVTLTLTGE